MQIHAPKLVVVDSFLALALAQVMSGRGALMAIAYAPGIRPYVHRESFLMRRAFAVVFPVRVRDLELN
jgi:hypothetical protein